MSFRYEDTLNMDIGGGGYHELKLVVMFTVSPGTPGTGAGYYPPELYDPGSPDEVNIQRVRLFDENGAELNVPTWLASVAETDAALTNSLIEHYYERIAA